MSDLKNEQKKPSFKNIGDLPVRVTDWIGSTTSIIVHTIFFIVIFVLRFFGFTTSDVLLLLTTAVSLEAIYLSIFIQMTVNRSTQSLVEVEEDIDEIQKDVDEIQEDVDEIQKDVDKIEEDVDKIEEDVDEIQEDVDEIEEQKKKDKAHQDIIANVEKTLERLTREIEQLKNEKK